jgi:3-oxoacyl-(acyl-carrier-protein) synthase
MFNRPASVASIRHRLTGSSHVVSVACASAAVALGDAFHRVRFGLADGVVVAGADSGLDLMTFAAWNRLGVLSRNPDPVRASRPFDRQRDGLVMGEGAAGFVLESFESAERRGVPVRAEVAGYGATSDATHLVRPNAVTQAQAIRKALASASMSPEQIDYVNAHGTATVPADITETASLLEALGGHGRQVPVANSKGQLGHLMGAAAGIELVATILALQRQVIAPCRNLDDPDPGCPLNFVRHQPLAARVSCALKNCFAFGGTNSVVVLKQAPSAPAPSAPAAPRFHNL